MIIKSKSTRITHKIAEKFAKELLAHEPKTKKALVIGLKGELGSGKTTFVQGFAKGLGIKNKIVSPTFIIMRIYRPQSKKINFSLHHLDAYRIEKQKEFSLLYFKQMISDPKNIILVEWVDKIKRALPKEFFLITFNYGKGKNERIIKFKIVKSL
ncbi:MAG: tRNA (adenosine(37)-N6)-threonylcarbamoyltransferase complex ATPase subunit type 1 TsaE [Patescibacteria group bacterium]|nr:tRNA (adenosine(37)-N6)-threonylcarbamoyltransferase complex ATPase subunit type 1 TsaE [Patescibacteria group bacterium]